MTKPKHRYHRVIHVFYGQGSRMMMSRSVERNVYETDDPLSLVEKLYLDPDTIEIQVVTPERIWQAASLLTRTIKRIPTFFMP